MVLKTLMLKRNIDQKKEALCKLREHDAEFTRREVELEAAIAEVETEEQEQAVSAEVDKFETEKTDHDTAIATLSAEIAALEAELAEIEKKAPDLRDGQKKQIERNEIKMDIDIRNIPMNKRAFDAMNADRKSVV